MAEVYLTSENADKHIAAGPLLVPVAANVDCKNKPQVTITGVNSGVTSQQILHSAHLNVDCLSLGSPVSSFLRNSSVGYIRTYLDTDGNHTTFNFQAESFTQFLVQLDTSLRMKAFSVPQKLLYVFRNQSMGPKKLQIMRPNNTDFIVDKTLARGEVLVYAVQPDGTVYLNGSPVSLAQEVTASNLAPGALLQVIGDDGAHVRVNGTDIFNNQTVQVQ